MRTPRVWHFNYDLLPPYMPAQCDRSSAPRVWIRTWGSPPASSWSRIVISPQEGQAGNQHVSSAQPHITETLFWEGMTKRSGALFHHPDPVHKDETVPQYGRPRILGPNCPLHSLLLEWRFHTGKDKQIIPKDITSPAPCS